MLETNHPTIESAVGSIWSEALGIQSVGVHEDFFALGGDSLLAVRVIAEINRHFAIDLTLEVFFESDFTVEHLARIVTRAVHEREEEQTKV